MANPDFSVELAEQLSDQRSNEIAYKLSIYNRGAQALNLLSITPFLPDSVRLSETKSTSFTAVAEQRSANTKELDALLQVVMDVEESSLLAKRVDVWKEVYRQLGSASGFFGFYIKAFSGRFAKQMKELALRERAFKYSVENYEDGVKAQDAFVNTSSLAQPVKDLYRLKLEKLHSLEQRIGAGVEAATLAAIQSNSTFSTTYVLTFKRRPLTGRKYNITFEVAVAEDGKLERHVAVQSASLLIAPQGYILNLVVILAATMGVVLKAAALDPKLQAAAMKVWTDPAGIGWPLAQAIIVAVVFFNAYEFTTFADRVKMALSWRSAMFIGTICGLVSDRIVAALQTFLK